MDAGRMLIEAQMHMEYMNEALIDMAPAIGQLTGIDGAAKLATAWSEVNARLWAAIHLVQSVRLGREDDGLAEALLEARCFDKADDAQVQDGLH